MFLDDYATARQRFQESARRAGAQLHSLPIDSKGPAGEDLAIDIAWIGSNKARRAILHSSGIHGVEGFAGSAIQLQLLENVPRLPEETALIVVHILNPYGMAWLRRVNENNVDLNRNFFPFGAYRGVPSAYAKLDSFLNPPSPPASDFFSLKAAGFVLRYGFTPLKQAIAGGQYEFPRGLFFGGKELQPGLARYQTFLRERLASAESVLAVDVHTGLGKYGEDSLLVDAADYDRLRPAFGERVRAIEAKKGPAYRIEGGLPNLVSATLPHSRLTFIGQEFGTYNPVSMLHKLRQENRWHHYGGGHVNHASKRALKEAFCPDEENWRRAVLRRGRDLLKQAVDYGMLAPTGGKNASFI